MEMIPCFFMGIIFWQGSMEREHERSKKANCQKTSEQGDETLVLPKNELLT